MDQCLHPRSLRLLGVPVLRPGGGTPGEHMVVCLHESKEMA